MDSVAHDFMKCYQYWSGDCVKRSVNCRIDCYSRYHRRFLVEKTGDYAHELRSIALSVSDRYLIRVSCHLIAHIVARRQQELSCLGSEVATDCNFE